ncbi:cupredoxin domain-containing protein [Paraburkholderia sp. BL10I2N1]|uniref:cupredoxin domain-containing protein n=1 Tax=Paraburkholderia sp. BL10I2N1 TaxID=1938796 RepID=UPI00105C190C|nr:cupredoxin domain-containing protein [Paraburkholderia sp. BL10I2N1]TDN70779.1 cupredoxin-like protein [Paraburkholderia sp. BL10I2N1]
MIDRNLTAFVLAAVVLGVAPLSGHADETIHVKLTDNTIQLDPGTANAGRITFEVNNAANGNAEHEFVVLRTDMDDAHLPVHKGQVAESRFKKMGEVEDLAQGSTRRLSLKLAPGRYVLICNRPGHYEMGMHTSFVVAR